MKNILIISTDGLGDLVMRLPFFKVAVDYVRENNYNLKFIVASDTEKEAIKNFIDLKNCNYEIFSCKGNGKNSFWLFLYMYGFLLRNKIDKCFCLNLPDRLLGIIFFYIINVKENYFSIKNINNSRFKNMDNINIIKEFSIGHKTDVALEFCKFLNKKGSIDYVFLGKDSNDKRNSLTDRNRNFSVVIAPASGSQRWKLWPVECYIELCRLLYQKYSAVKITFVGAGSDIDILNEIKVKVDNSKCNFIYNKEIGYLIDFLSKADLFIGGDCGVLHVASTIKSLKCIGLFGPTDVLLTGPKTENFTYIYGQCKDSPCFDHRIGLFNCNNVKCMKNIKPEYVVCKIEELLK